MCDLCSFFSAELEAQRVITGLRLSFDFGIWNPLGNAVESVEGQLTKAGGELWRLYLVAGDIGA